jgi:hypothetical protein
VTFVISHSGEEYSIVALGLVRLPGSNSGSSSSTSHNMSDTRESPPRWRDIVGTANSRRSETFFCRRHKSFASHRVGKTQGNDWGTDKGPGLGGVPGNYLTLLPATDVVVVAAGGCGVEVTSAESVELIPCREKKWVIFPT